jgi:Na+/proline symporter
VHKTEQGPALTVLENKYNELGAIKQQQVRQLAAALESDNSAQVAIAKKALQHTDDQSQEVRSAALTLIQSSDPAADVNDTNYIFLHFVVNSLPKGLVGLLIAIIFLAAWGSIAAALNSLASTTVIDVYKRLYNKNASPDHYLKISKLWTLIWGVFCILVAQFAGSLGSLIEVVNILGSWFYGVTLGIFMVAFYLKRVGGTATFWAALIAEAVVLITYWTGTVSFLWLNAIGCLLVVGLAYVFQVVSGKGVKLRA